MKGVGKRGHARSSRTPQTRDVTRSIGMSAATAGVSGAVFLTLICMEPTARVSATPGVTSSALTSSPMLDSSSRTPAYLQSSSASADNALTSPSTLFSSRLSSAGSSSPVLLCLLTPSATVSPLKTPASLCSDDTTSLASARVTEAVPLMEKREESSAPPRSVSITTESSSWSGEESTESSTSSQRASVTTYVQSSVQEAVTLESHPLFKASAHVRRVALPILIVVGTIGNALVVVIHRRLPASQKSCMTIFLDALAVSDTLALWQATFWILDTFGIGSVSSGPGEGEQPSVTDVVMDCLCKLRVWGAYAVGENSAWLLVSMTVHRALHVVWPTRTRSVLTKRNTRIVIAVIASFCALTNAHIFYGHSLLQGRGRRRRRRTTTADAANATTNTVPATAGSVEACFFSFASESYGVFFNDVWVWVDILFSALLPALLLSVTNTVLVWSVGKALKEARDLGSGNDALKSRDKRMSSMTLSLIVMSVAFFFLAVPVCIFMIAQKTAVSSAGQDVSHMAAIELALSVVLVLWYANFAINFYMYCLTGAKYRAAFSNLCRTTYIDNSASTF